MRTIALVEDEEVIRENYADVLCSEGFAVQAYASVSEAKAAFDEALPDVVLLDIGLQGDPEGGYGLCSWLRQRSAVLPILFLTSLNSEVDKISGMRLGADDYITKDNSIDYVVIRIHALFRRIEALSGAPEPAVADECPLVMNDNTLIAYWFGQAVDLTLTQYWILKSLVDNQGAVQNHQDLMWAAKSEVEPNTIVAHIQAIRRKFKELDGDFAAIRTERGNGYRWLPTTETRSISAG